MYATHAVNDGEMKPEGDFKEAVVTNPLQNDFCSNAISGILHGNVTPVWRLYGVI